MKTYFKIFILNIYLILLAITQLPIRILNLLKHLCYFGYKKSYYHRLWFWPILLLFSLIDLLLLPEILHFILCLFKFNMRFLSENEILEAKKVFGESLNYQKIILDENSLFANWGAKLAGKNQLGVVIFYSVNFTKKINGLPKSDDMEWLIHELTHLLQLKKVGSSYIFYALYGQHTDGYYLNKENLKTLNQYNFEQQAEICRFYYQEMFKTKQNKFENLLVELKNGNFI